jgi:hypothetical protein
MHIEGLRIELTESAAGTFFDSGSTNMSLDGSDLVKLLAQELGKLPNQIAIEGHTDSKPYPPRAHLHQLGAFRRPCQYRAPLDADQRDSRGPNHAGPRLCRSASAQTGSATRPIQSKNLLYRSVPAEPTEEAAPAARRGEGAKAPGVKPAAWAAEQGAKSTAGEAAAATPGNPPEKK